MNVTINTVNEIPMNVHIECVSGNKTFIAVMKGSQMIECAINDIIIDGLTLRYDI